MSRRIRKVGPALLVAIALGTGLAACGGGADLPSGVVAQVGDAAIKTTELDRALKQREAQAKQQGATVPEPGTEGYDQLRQQALDTLVQQHIVDFEAAKCGEPCKVTKDDVSGRLAEVKERNFGGSEEEFTKFLKESELSLADARTVLRSGLQQEKLFDHVTRGVRFTAEDAQKYYDDHPAEFRRAAGRTVSHILVETEAEAEALRAQATPANFNQLAREHSTDPSAATNGGDLGELTRGSGFVPEFENAAFELKDGEISQPVKTQFGWHLILVHLRAASVTSFDDAREGIIRTQLQQARQTAFTTWRDKVIAEWRAKTEYAESKLEPPEPEAAPEAGSTD